MNEAVRRGAWTCIGCSAISRAPQALIASSPKHQRKHSSSKASSSSKDEPRPIAAASVDKTPTEPPAVKRTGGRRSPRAASKPSAIKARLEAYPNIPSVPSTSHLHPKSTEALHLIDERADLSSRCPRCLILLSSPTHISYDLLPSRILGIRLLLHLRTETPLKTQSLRCHHYRLLRHRQRRERSIPSPRRHLRGAIPHPCQTIPSLQQRSGTTSRQQRQHHHTSDLPRHQRPLPIFPAFRATSASRTHKRYPLFIHIRIIPSETSIRRPGQRTHLLHHSNSNRVYPPLRRIHIHSLRVPNRALLSPSRKAGQQQHLSIIPAAHTRQRSPNDRHHFPFLLLLPISFFRSSRRVSPAAVPREDEEKAAGVGRWHDGKEEADLEGD